LISKVTTDDPLFGVVAGMVEMVTCPNTVKLNALNARDRNFLMVLSLIKVQNG
jgi:hypothetical protein